jgi:hypothetical protein
MSTIKQQHVEVKSALLKTIWKALSQQEASADTCLDKKRQPEADSSLPDYENVPLSQPIDTYNNCQPPPAKQALDSFSKASFGLLQKNGPI